MKHSDDTEGKGYCPVCNEILNGKCAVQAHNLTLTDGIIVNFYMDLTDKVDASNTKMKFTYNGKTSEATPVSKKVEGVTYDYTYSCELFATEMNETITAEFYEGDEKLATYTYSVKAYCDNTLTDESNTTNDLINAMMTYGGMSQLYFGQENPVSSVEPAALDTDELDKLKNGYLKQDFTYDSKYNPNGEKIRVYGMTLVLYAETALRAGFSLGTGYAMSDFVFTPYMKSGDTYVAISNEVKSGVYRDANG
ncbi:MAG: hypothetical protein IJB84_00005, partial [Lachnospiraceae bacterium]|nr:hypothetical protein [Lachnospiraceae bacterium]